MLHMVAAQTNGDASDKYTKMRNKMPEMVYKEKVLTFQGKIHKDIAAEAQPQKACNRSGTEGGGQPRVMAEAG